MLEPFSASWLESWAGHSGKCKSCLVPRESARCLFCTDVTLTEVCRCAKKLKKTGGEAVVVASIRYLIYRERVWLIASTMGRRVDRA